MKNIHSIDTDSFALTGASVSPANTSVLAADFPSDLDVMRMVASSRAVRNVYVASKIGQAIETLTSKVALWHRTRTTRQALTGLDNHLLRDIGLERADIEQYAVNSKPGTIARGFSAVTKAVARWNAARLTQSALHKLTNAQLNDIGLSRHDIDVLARDIRTGRIETPTTVLKSAAVEAPQVKAVRKIVRPVNSNSVSSWFISPRRAA